MAPAAVELLGVGPAAAGGVASRPSKNESSIASMASGVLSDGVGVVVGGGVGVGGGASFGVGAVGVADGRLLGVGVSDGVCFRRRVFVASGESAAAGVPGAGVEEVLAAG